MSPERVDAGQWIEHLSRHLEVARAGVDPEGVHQVRVAARRLRVWLTLGGHEALRDDLRRLSQRLGPARDLELIEGVPSMERWRQQRRDEALQRVREALDPERARALIKGLRALEAPSLEQAGSHLRHLVKRVKKSIRRLRHARKGDRFEAAHRLRRDARTLRFAQEWLGQDAKRCTRVQESLGHICDVRAVRQLISAWAKDTGCARQAKGLIRQLDSSVAKGLRRP